MEIVSRWEDLDDLKVKNKDISISRDGDEYRLYKTLSKEECMGNVTHMVSKLWIWDSTTDDLKQVVSLLELMGFDIDYQPFNVPKFLKGTLEITQFSQDEDIFCFEFCEGKIIFRRVSVDLLGTKYFKFKYKFIDIVDVLNNNKITIEQLKNSLKELRWL